MYTIVFLLATIVLLPLASDAAVSRAPTLTESSLEYHYQAQNPQEGRRPRRPTPQYRANECGGECIVETVKFSKRMPNVIWTYLPRCLRRCSKQYGETPVQWSRLQVFYQPVINYKFERCIVQKVSP